MKPGLSATLYFLVWALAHLVVLALVLAAAAIAGGCSRELVYAQPDGSRLEYRNSGFDTKAGKVSVTTPDGLKIEVENLDSTSRAMELAGKALDALKAVP